MTARHMSLILWRRIQYYSNNRSCDPHPPWFDGCGKAGLPNVSTAVSVTLMYTIYRSGTQGWNLYLFIFMSVLSRDEWRALEDIAGKVSISRGQVTSKC
ncbi:hypothetical protein M404DRAFT_506157 [Pisolithus tinctorius Marx 270]|uniref:Uncharacterized protein n=1 Tax=Pisolithus tinctorius Marx 270 TaxID=870435 RepID=A0A0C3PCV2_PISTI|nr:hypothetical protein M404DRAFT_506157 [Pisolithus tinctorius Marx 270]